MRKILKVGDRAKFAEILLVLSDESLTFNELRKKLDVSPSTLSRRISEMEEYGLIMAGISEEKPKRVKYGLTDKGKCIVPLVSKIVDLYKQIDDEIMKKSEE